jgi:hypothetical protein
MPFAKIEALASTRNCTRVLSVGFTANYDSSTVALAWASLISPCKHLRLVWHVVKHYAGGPGLTKLAPHDLRRSCARLCHSAGAIDCISGRFLVREMTDTFYPWVNAESEIVDRLLCAIYGVKIARHGVSIVRRCLLLYKNVASEEANHRQRLFGVGLPSRMGGGLNFRFKEQGFYKVHLERTTGV